MDITTKVFFSEADICDILDEYLFKKGFRLIDDFEINVFPKENVPKGATAGDQIGINATVVKLKTKKKK